MIIQILGLALLLLINFGNINPGECSDPSTQFEKQPVYNQVIPGRAANLDPLVHKFYGARFKIINIESKDGFVPAKAAEGIKLPNNAMGRDGKELKGYVLVFYLITDKGLVTNPMIVKSTNQRLNQTALRAMDKWQFTPATLKGKSVWSTAAQEFVFKKAGRKNVLCPNNVIIGDWRRPQAAL